MRMHSAGPGGWQPASPATTTGPAVNADPNITAATATAVSGPKAQRAAAVAVAAVSVQVASAQVGRAGLASLVASAVRVGLVVSGGHSAVAAVAASVVPVAAGVVTSAPLSSRSSARNPATATS